MLSEMQAHVIGYITVRPNSISVNSQQREKSTQIFTKL